MKTCSSDKLTLFNRYTPFDVKDPRASHRLLTLCDLNYLEHDGNGMLKFTSAGLNYSTITEVLKGAMTPSFLPNLREQFPMGIDEKFGTMSVDKLGVSRGDLNKWNAKLMSELQANVRVDPYTGELHYNYDTAKIPKR